MAKLLYIESSPRKSRSKSIAVANAFIDAYKAIHPVDEVEKIDLWDKALPEFDGYMDLLLGFIGFTDVFSIMVEPTLSTPDKVSLAESEAIHLARTIASKI